jgi:PKD repeat protein
MMRGTALTLSVLVVGGAVGCNSESQPGATRSSLVGSPSDPSPTVSFTQGAQALGIKRSLEPASASSCPQPPAGSTLSYGTWLSDFDGDGLLDVYDVNHGQGCHLSGLWLNNGAGSFGKNLWTVGVGSASTNGAALNLSNEMMYVGDMTGDGRVDMYFLDWSGLGAMCVNTGNAAHSDWTGPSFTCYQALEPKAFGDVNGDGKIDVEVIDATPPYDVYKDYCRTAPTSWRLNNGNPNFNTWPADSNYFDFVGKAAPGTLLDFNKDGYPDKLQGIEVSGAARGPYSTSSGGLRLSLGQANGTYLPVTSGLESVVQPVVKIEDIDEDGCLDIGTDQTAYRDNQSWYVQDRSGTTCLATFHGVARTSLPYYPGARRYSFDVDNDGLMDKAVIVHNGYGNQDGKKEGVHLFRKLPAGTWSDLGAVGIGINGTSNTEFYADELNPGDWNNDGKMDLAGVGNTTIAGADSGIALWTSNLSTTNKWIKVQLPTVSGFFAGTATIEIFDAGFAGDPTHYVTAPKVLRTGQVWTNQVHHFGIGTRSSVDIKVTFPDGKQTIQTGVSANLTVGISATANIPPVATATASPMSVGIGQAVSFDGSGSSDVDGTIALYSWSFGDGTTGAGPMTTHAFAAPGSYMVTLTVRDNSGSTTSTIVGVSVNDVTAPTIAINSFTITPNVADDVAVASVAWSIDGVAQTPVTKAPFAFTVGVSALAPGAHVISCQATDTSGNQSGTSSIGINE